MTLAQYEARTRALRAAVTKARNASKASNIDLREKLFRQGIVKDKQARLDAHLLARFDLVAD